LTQSGIHRGASQSVATSSDGGLSRASSRAASYPYASDSDGLAAGLTDEFGSDGGGVNFGGISDDDEASLTAQRSALTSKYTINLAGKVVARGPAVAAAKVSSVR
jgi:hypothetical protein